MLSKCTRMCLFLNCAALMSFVRVTNTVTNSHNSAKVIMVVHFVCTLVHGIYISN